MPDVLTSPVTTAEQLLAFDEPGYRHELVRGELRRSPYADWWHGVVAAQIGGRLFAHAERHDLGVVFAAGTGFLLERSPDTVRAADAAFVRADRCNPLPARGYLEGAPDLAVEVTSPDDRFADVQDKVLDWLRSGCRLCWVIESQARRVTVWRPGGEGRRLTVADTLLGEDVLPGFTVPVAELFPVRPEGHRQ
ncbi:MAG: Uma2 family endonuclease [Planctomycetota bacterium]